MAVSLPLTEQIIDGVIAKLQAGLAARVATINAADTAGVTIAAPDRFYVGGFDDGIAPPSPAIVVMDAPSEYAEEGPHSFILRAEIMVGVYDLDTGRQQLARKLLRQARAVIETIWDDAPQESLFVAGSSTVKAAHRIFPVRNVPGPVFDPNTESQWSGLYGVVFRADQLAG